MIDEDNINKRVLLLAIYKKLNNESFEDIVLTLCDNKMFTPQEGNDLVKELQTEGYLTADGLSMIGVAEAKAIELSFKM